MKKSELKKIIKEEIASYLTEKMTDRQRYANKPGSYSRTIQPSYYDDDVDDFKSKLINDLPNTNFNIVTNIPVNKSDENQLKKLLAKARIRRHGTNEFILDIPGANAAIYKQLAKTLNTFKNVVKWDGGKKFTILNQKLFR